MKPKLVILGVASFLLLAACVAGISLMSFAGQLFFGPEEQKPRAIRIAPVGPLATPVTVVTYQIIESPPEAVPAPLKQPLPTEPPTATASPTNTPTPTATPSPTATASPTNTPSPTATPTPVISQPGIASRLVIPRLDLDAPVLLSPIENQTWRVDHLGQETVGHLEGTAPPGSDSNMVLAGHVTLAAEVYGPFANLGQLAIGDLVMVYEGDKEFLYQVDSQQTVDRAAIEVVYPSETGQITLITCTNWNSQEGRYSDRLVVKGHLIKD